VRVITIQLFPLEGVGDNASLVVLRGAQKPNRLQLRHVSIHRFEYYLGTCTLRSASVTT